MAGETPPSEDESGPGDSLASRLHWLLQRVPDPYLRRRGGEKKPYSYQGVSDAIRRRDADLPRAMRAARAVSKPYFANIVAGRMENPSLPKLEAIAGVFDVPVAFLQPGGPDDAAVVEDVVSRFREETTAELERELLMFRARNLSPQAVRRVLQTIEELSEQGTDADRPPPPA